MTIDRFPETPGLAEAAARVGRAYDAANKRDAAARARKRMEAAAPDMLAALKAFVAACGGNPPDWLRDEYAAAETAIAKAVGAA